MTTMIEGLMWTGPRDFRARLQFQSELPTEPGFYAFTDSEHLRPGTVLYVGATLNLRSRIPKYDFSTLGGQPRPNVLHAGMIQIRNWQSNPGNKLFVWWTLYPALKKEKELVSGLVPRFNDKLTDEVGPTWGFPK
jgi:excinuclease UvrABC nuclease subunit